MSSNKRSGIGYIGDLRLSLRLLGRGSQRRINSYFVVADISGHCLNGHRFI